MDARLVPSSFPSGFWSMSRSAIARLAAIATLSLLTCQAASGAEQSRQWSDKAGCAETASYNLGPTPSSLEWDGDCDGGLRHGIGYLKVGPNDKFTGNYRHGVRVGYWGRENKLGKEEYFHAGDGQAPLSRTVYISEGRRFTLQVRNGDTYTEQKTVNYRVVRDTFLITRPTDKASILLPIARGTFVRVLESDKPNAAYIRIVATRDWPVYGYLLREDLQPQAFPSDDEPMRAMFNAQEPVPSPYAGVGYPDDRRFVRDVDKSPFNAMARLRIRGPDGKGGLCSAAFVYRPDLLVTAAHCAFAHGDPKSQTVKVEIVDTSGKALESIDGQFIATGDYTGERGLSTVKEDWALVKIAAAPRSRAITPFKMVDDAAYLERYNRDMMKLGFPADRDLRPVASYCNVDTFGMHVRFNAPPEGTQQPPGYFALETRSTCVSFYGDSGGPLLWYDRQNGAYAIVGIVSGNISPEQTYSLENGEVKLTLPPQVSAIRDAQRSIDPKYKIGDAVFDSDSTWGREGASMSSNLILAIQRIGSTTAAHQSWEQISKAYASAGKGHDVQLTLKGAALIVEYIGQNMGSDDTTIFAPDIQGLLVKGARLPQRAAVGAVMRIPQSIYKGEIITSKNVVDADVYLVGGTLVVANHDTHTVVGTAPDFLIRCLIKKPVCPALQ